MRTRTVVLIGALALAAVVAAIALPRVNAAPSRHNGPPAASGSGEQRQASDEEKQLQAKVAGSADAQSMLRLARLQEGRGAGPEAEATLLKLNEMEPFSVAALRAVSTPLRVRRER